jgi:hypothetical protein
VPPVLLANIARHPSGSRLVGESQGTLTASIPTPERRWCRSALRSNLIFAAPTGVPRDRPHADWIVGNQMPIKGGYLAFFSFSARRFPTGSASGSVKLPFSSWVRIEIIHSNDFHELFIYSIFKTTRPTTVPCSMPSYTLSR